MSASRELPFPVWARFEFTGNATDYFQIWIVNMALTVVTLGIYSAWAKVRRENYFYGNTRLKDSSFRFTAAPLTILKGRLLAVLVFAMFWISTNAYPAFSLWALALGCLLFPFVIVSASSFRMHNTVWRNLRFRFDRDYAGAYRLFIIPIAILIGITALLYGLWEASDVLAEIELQLEQEGGEENDFKKEDMLFSIFFLALLPMIPLVTWLLRRFTITRTHYGNADGAFSASAWSFYVPYLKLFAIGMLGMFAFAMLAGGAAALFAPETDGGSDEQGLPLQMIPLIFLAVVVFYGGGFYLLGYIKSRIANLTWNHAALGPVALHSNLRARDLGTLYLTNTIAIIFSLGLLVPWTQIRMARYKASRIELLAQDEAAIEAIEQAAPAAYGEELGDVFDLDLGL